MTSGDGFRPPPFWAFLAGLLIRGEHTPFIQADLEEALVRDLEAGMSRRRASRRYARNVMGSIWSVWVTGLKGLFPRGTLLDAKLGVRMLGKQPLLTVVAMLALGLGIPASLSLYHLVDIFTRPLPVPAGERVMGLRLHDRERGDPLPSSIHDLEVWREGLSSFQAVGAARSYSMTLHAGDAGAPPVRGAEMTASAFDVLRAAPLLGRVLGPADEVPGGPEVVILGEDLWASRFGRDPDIVGQTVEIGRTRHEVVGVLPADFRFPQRDQIWLPLRLSPLDYPPGGGPGLHVFGRLAEGVSGEEAELELRTTVPGLVEERPGGFERYAGEVVPMPLLLVGEDKIEWGGKDRDLVAGQAVMTLFLLIVCGNVGILLLARTATRSGEISIRTALGASRTRIVGQIVIEALVLAVLATGAGLLAAEGIARAVMGIMRPLNIIPYWMDFTLRWQVVVVALAVAALAAALAGVIPGLKATGRSVEANLKRTAAGHSTMRFGWGSSVLIVAEVVLSVGFLAMGGVMVRSFFQDTEGRLGFEPERYMTTLLVPPSSEPAGSETEADEAGLRQRHGQLHREVRKRVAAEPGVRAVGMGLQLPGTTSGGNRIVLEPRPGQEAAVSEVRVPRLYVDAGFFRGLDRPILVGRDFSAADVEGREGGEDRPVIVNTTFVEQVMGGRNPVGQRFRYPRYRPAEEDEEHQWYEIVGVVGPFGANPVNPSRDAAVYEPMAPGETARMGYLVEVAGDPAALVPRFREIVAQVDPEATALQARPVTAMMEAERSIFRWFGLMPVVLAGVAFLLSVSGLYALMSFTVSQRTREIGIRTALGARAWNVVSTIARRAALQLGVGLTLGAGWAWMLLNEISHDSMMVPVNIPLTIGFTLLCATLVGAAACASPTIRGLRIQPSEALREF